MDALLVIQMFLATGLHASNIMFITEILSINSIHLKIHHSHEQCTQYTRLATSLLAVTPLDYVELQQLTDNNALIIMLSSP